MKEYYPRICDRVLQNKLKITGAVLSNSEINFF